MQPDEDTAVDDSVEALGDFIEESLEANPDANPEGSGAEEPDEHEASNAAETEEDNLEPEGDSPELADSLEGLAEQLGLETEDLLGLKVTVKANGEDKSVNLADALAGHTMEADYRQKTAQVADDRRLLSEAVDMATTEWQSRLSEVDAMREVLQEMLAEDAAGLDQYLHDGDTDQYLLAKSRLETRQRRLADVHGTRTRQQTEMAEQNRQKQGKARASEQQKLLARMPELKDPAKLQAFQGDLSQYLTGVGYTEQEIGNWMNGSFDHRQILLIADGMKRSKAVKAQPALRKKLKLMKKVLKPGAAPDPGDAARNRDAELKNRVRKSGGNDMDLTNQLFEQYS